MANVYLNLVITDRNYCFQRDLSLNDRASLV